jgi:hypothetical protein
MDQQRGIDLFRRGRQQRQQFALQIVEQRLIVVRIGLTT